MTAKITPGTCRRKAEGGELSQTVDLMSDRGEAVHLEPLSRKN
jgi:hypothetical protein